MNPNELSLKTSGVGGCREAPDRRSPGSRQGVVQCETAGVLSDKGITWHAAEFDSQTTDHAWRLWLFNWKPSTIGNHILMSRATDAAGNTQPAQHNEDYESCLIDHIIPVPVEVI